MFTHLETEASLSQTPQQTSAAHSVSHQSSTASTRAAQTTDNDDDDDNNNALFLCSATSPIRKFLVRFLESESCRYTITALTFLHWMLLCVTQTGFEQPSLLWQIVTNMDIVVTMVFAAHIILSCIAYGVVINNTAYLRRSSWNVVCVVSTAICVLQVVPFLRESPWVRCARMLRVLHTVVALPPLEHTMQCLRRAMPLLMVNLVLLVYVMAIFAIIAIKSWQGDLDRRCYSPSTPRYRNVSTLLFIPIDWPCGSGFTCSQAAQLPFVDSEALLNASCDIHLEQYETYQMNFNNLATALLLLARVVSLDNVQESIIDVMAISGKPFALFIVILVILTSFLCVHLFLAILMDAFLSDQQVSESSIEESISGGGRSTSKSLGPGIRDVGTQANQITGEEGDVSSRPSTPPALGALVEGSALGRLLSGLSMGAIEPSSMFTPTKTSRDVAATPSLPSTNELPAWRRRIPLPFMESVQKRGFWSTLIDLECTTSRPSLSGEGAVRVVQLLHSRVHVIVMSMLSLATAGCLCALHDGMDLHVEAILVNVTIAASLATVVPLGLKFVVYGAPMTLSDFWNLVDIAAVATAIFELSARDMFANYSLLRGLRTIRLLRIGKYITPLERFTRSVFSSWQSLMTVIGAFLAFLLFFAVIGMQLFGTSYSSRYIHRLPSTLWDSRMTRDSFATLWESLLMCFIILSGDRWTVRLQIALRLDGVHVAASVIFFLSLYIVGNFIVMNIFVVLLTESTTRTLLEEATEVEVEQPPELLLPPFQPVLVAKTGARQPTALKHFSSNEHRFVDSLEDMNASYIRKWVSWLLEVRPSKAVGKSFFVFPVSNDVRRFSIALLSSTLYRLIMMGAVLANVIFLFFEGSEIGTIFEETAYLVLLVLFWIEIFLKMIAFGVFLPSADVDPTVLRPHTPAFFRDWWNIVDFVANVLCLAAQVIPTMRAAVALRVLRLASWTEYTRRILAAMLESLPPAMNALLIALYYTLIFGVLGVQLFGGRFWKCSDASMTSHETCVGNASQVFNDFTNVTAPRQWMRSEFHFDSFPSAVLSIFVIATGGYWTLIMYDGMDVGDVNQGLRQNEYPLYCLYFVAAYLLINMFALKLTIAVLINFFSRMNKRRDGSLLLTAEQQQYVKARDTIEALIVDKNADLMPSESSSLSRFLHGLLTFKKRRWFSEPVIDVIIRAVVWVNSIVILTTHRDTLSFESTLRDVVDLTALAIFVIDATMRVGAYGWRQYLAVPWNVADLVIIPLILMGYVFNGTMPVSFFRVVVLVKLIKHTRVEELLWYIAKNLLQYMFVLMLLFLVFFVYAAAGVIIFGNVQDSLPGTNEMFNFRNVPSALLVLFHSSTGRGWEPVMNALSVESADCVLNGVQRDGCGSQSKAVAFFVTFMVIAVFAVLHLLVAVVIEIFRTNVDPTEPTIAAFFQLKEVWERHFGYSCALVHIDEFLAVIPEIPTLLTGLTFGRRAAFMRLVASLQVPIDSKHRLLYKDVLRAFVWRRYKVETKSALFLFQESHALQSAEGSGSFTVAHALAARIIQRMYRAYRQKEREAYRNRMMAMRRQILRRRGTYDDIEDDADKVMHGNDEVSARRRASISKHQSFSQELMNMFESLRVEQPSELRFSQPKGVSLPRGAENVPDATIFAFGAVTQPMSEVASVVE